MMPESWKERERERTCPSCGMYITNPVEYEIKWDEIKRQFKVAANYNCEMCPPDETLIKEITTTVAERSTCECGSSLKLKDYKVSRKGDELEFEGTYECAGECIGLKRRLLGGLRAAVREIWEKVDTVELTPEGVKIST